MKRLGKWMVVTGFAAIFLSVAPAQAQIFVDCDAGDSIQDALDAQAGDPFAGVDFVGTCYEFVTISHDRAGIFGHDGATLYGQLRIFGPSNVVLRDFTITGDGHGLMAFGGRTRAGNVNFNGNLGFGVLGEDGATIRLNSCWVADNQLAHGIVLYNSAVRMSNTHVLGHPDLGIAALENSRVFSAEGSVGNNQRGIFATNGSAVVLDGTHVTDHVIDGILLTTSSSATLTNAVLTRNGGHGIDLSLNTSAELQGGAITDNGESGVYVANHSFARLTGTEVTGNTTFGVSLINDSGVAIGDFTSVPENQSGWAVYCNGKESGIDISDLANVGRKKCPDPKF